MPPKKKPAAKAEAKRNEEDKKRTNLRDLLSRSSSMVSRPLKKTDTSEVALQRSASQPSNAPALRRGKKIRKLNADDMAITPDAKRVRQTPGRSTRKQNALAYEEHSTTTQVALPLSDTPIIRRNQEMRNGKSVRRSSMEKRGKRVSSIGNGFTGLPHDRVPTSDFYKHLDSTLPDPHKMRQLLSWCSRRVLDEDNNKHIQQKNILPSKELTALNIAKVIKEEMVRDLVDGKFNISWWNRDEDEGKSETQVLLPNERNVKNAQVLEQLKQRLKVLQNASAQWGSNMSKLVELPTISMDHVPHIEPDEKYQSVLDNSLINELSALEESSFNDISTEVEFALDNFTTFVHQIKSLSSLKQKIISKRSNELSSILDKTIDDDTLDKINNNEINKDLDTDQLLKGIAKLDR